QSQFEGMIKLVEEYTGKSINGQERAMIARGADEIDLVRSGLEETMITAYHAIRNTLKSNDKIQDMRTAAFVTAILKISNDYESLGIWP
ncbi:MAG: hypothetical protein RL386_1209, partial [Bacteroidota bacterium]